MYQLLIVDDEPSIRRGMANCIAWNEIGFSVAGMAENGKKAVEFIENNQVDIVLSDIRMPEMDGVELMKYLNQNHPGIKIVILSGYNDFEYLNMSIKNNVAEYLLKPTDYDEFEALFVRMKNEMDSIRERAREYQYLKEEAEENQERNMLGILQRTIKGEEEEDEAKILEAYLRISLSRCVVIRCFVEDKTGQERWESLPSRKKIRKEIEALSEDFNWRFFLIEDKDLLCIAPMEEGELEEIEKKAACFQSKVIEALRLDCFIGISDFCSDIRMLPQSCQQAECCVMQKMFLPANTVQCYFKIREEEFEYYSVCFNEEEMERYILNNDKENMEREMDRVFQAFENNIVRQYHYIDRICLEYLFNISRWMFRYGFTLEQVLSELSFDYGDLYQFKNLKEKKSFLSKILYALTDRLQNHQDLNRKINSLGYLIKEYLDKEYCSNTISLDSVSDKLNKNPAYISKVFKDEIGENFSDYITKKRLQKGKALLGESDKKIYRIAEETGYADASTFIKVFKKNCGISPNDYRKRFKGGNSENTDV